MRNYFILGGEDSRDYGVYISGAGVFNAPARVVDFRAVPGRNGDLIGVKTRLQNGTLTFKDSFIFSDWHNRIAAFRAFLLGTNAYRRLVTSYDPNEYRMVAFTGPLEARPSQKLNAGQFDLVFNAMPQRFLIAGETAQAFTESGSIENPTRFPSKPMIRVYGNGVLGVGAVSVTISSNADNYMDIDCESGIACRGPENMNRFVALSGYDFPQLPPGETGLSLGTGITRIEITPRWWTV